MKKILFSLSVLLAASCQQSFATVHTLCNMPYSPGQFTNFSDAHDAAAFGDTIYVHGSNFSYGDIFIVKQLVIIGTGHNPNKQSPLVSSFGTIGIHTSNAQLIGLTFNALQTGLGASNGAIKKCRILGALQSALDISGSFWLIEGNIFDQQSYSVLSIDFNFSDGHIVQHNIFANLAQGIYGIVGGTPSYILNNVFLGDQVLFFPAFERVANAIIRNNIFYGKNPVDSSDPCTNCTIEKNITFNCADNNFYPIATFGPLNLIGVDPLFTNTTGIPTNLFLYTYDFKLQPTSPGRNYGSDGTDVGVFGGVGELFTMTGEPSIAEITTFTITSPTTIVPGGTLTISVTSKRVH
jgi:hypothetical protein